MRLLAQKYPLALFIALVLIPVHGILWPMRLSGVPAEQLQPFKIIFAMLPTAMAFLVTFLAQGEEAVRRLWGKCFLKQNRLKYYGHGLVSIVILGGLALLIRYFYDGQTGDFNEFPSILTMVVAAPFLLLFPGFTEEFGWRGFLQEKLQGKMGVFIASLLTGLVWGSWHSMDFLMGNWPTDSFSIMFFFLYITATSIIIGGVYVLSGGSVFVAMLVHFSANIVNVVLPVWRMESSEITPLIYIGLLWLVALLVLFIKAPKEKGLVRP